MGTTRRPPISSWQTSVGGGPGAVGVHGDGVEWRAVGQAGASVPDHDLDVGDPEIAEGGAGPGPPARARARS